MAIDFSYGYPGTIAPGVAWARMQWGLGTRYFVYHQDNVQVTPVPTGTRQVSISAGYFGAWGILDHNDAPVTVPLPTVSSGTRWFLIVARRTWQTTNATTFTYIDCGSTATYPAARNVQPGVIEDQPLAFVPLTAGSTVPGTPRDARVIGASPENQIILDEIALGYMAYVGVRLRLGTTQYVRGLNSAGNPVWQVEPGPYGTVGLASKSGSGVITANPGWALGSPRVNQVLRDGNTVQLTIQAGKIQGGLTFTGGGQITDVPVINIVDPEYRPDWTVQVPVLLQSPGAGNTHGNCVLTPDGRMSLTSATPNYNLYSTFTADGFLSLQGNVTYIKKG